MLIWNAYSRKIDALAFSPCGRTLALGGSNLACRLIDPITGKRLWTVRTRCGFGLSLGFTPDGSVLCRGSGLSTRSARDGTELRRCGNWCRAFGNTTDGRTAFLADVKYRDVVRGYDVRSGRARAEVELDAGALQRIVASPDGTLVAAVGRKRFHLLTADGLEVIASVAHRALSNGEFAVAFSPCGRQLVYTAGRTLFVWDVESASEMYQVCLDRKNFLDASFTSDGRWLITVSKEGTARVWDTTTWDCERSFGWNVGPLRAVAVAPDGTRAAVAGDSGRVVVWDLDA
jgi:WD40 repeat protein